MKSVKYLYYAAIALSLLIPQHAAHALDLPGLTWSDRVSKETADGDIEEVAPYVELGIIRLSRFSQMQSLTLQDTLTIGDGDDVETLFVFRAWQGGASQGEQLMLVTASASGVDVIGPYEQDFEKLVVIQPTGDFGPIFELVGADKEKPLARLEYFDGQLIKLVDR
ncbi:hypothetical protein [Lentilitoribacter sp. Alg239-R112]|uniref:hypothetical protein n=1 Tax=Lentilitoribacter sp. Alg239-R112 TaxID=2305987 RepID=UPI0013A6D2F1|nr:hypothetical protein [Lentilitoribacter sp. Alg239-R112]